MTDQRIDDLGAVRLIVDTLKDFKQDEQQRIFRWASEKLGFQHSSVTPATSVTPLATPTGTPHLPVPATTSTGATDIRTFMSQKKPRNDVQFAAAAAYFYRFEAIQAERKEAINKDDLQESARKATRERFADPLNTLNNAHKLGLMDKGSERGTFVINSVGENLVAMTLPDGTAGPKAGKKKPAKQVKQKAAVKKAKKALKR